MTGASKAEQDAMAEWEASAAPVVSVKYSPKLQHEEDVERLLVVVSPEEDAACLWRQRYLQENQTPLLPPLSPPSLANPSAAILPTLMAAVRTQ